MFLVCLFSSPPQGPSLSLSLTSCLTAPYPGALFNPILTTCLGVVVVVICCWDWWWDWWPFIPSKHPNKASTSAISTVVVVVVLRTTPTPTDEAKDELL